MNFTQPSGMSTINQW